MLSSKQRKQLKALAHGLKAVVHIGKGELEEKVIAAVHKALFDHELIKIKLLESVTTPKDEIAASLCVATGAELVNIIGHTLIMYKETEKDGIEKIKLTVATLGDE